MAEEPQPSQIHEGDQAPKAVPSSNRDEAAALDSLDSRELSDKADKKSVDTKALGNAMQNLNVGEKKEEVKKNVKVDAGDVGLLADYLEIPRPKATELLKANDADAVKAMRAWVAA